MHRSIECGVTSPSYRRAARPQIQPRFQFKGISQLVALPFSLRSRTIAQASDDSDGDEINIEELKKWLGIRPSRPRSRPPEQYDVELSADIEDGPPLNSMDPSNMDDLSEIRGLQRPLTPPNSPSGSSTSMSSNFAANSRGSSANPPPPSFDPRRALGQFTTGSNQSNNKKSGRPSPWTEWSASGPDAEWDDWSGTPVADLDDEEDIAELREQVIKKRQARRGKRTVVRDEYLRPIVDGQGIRNRLAFDERETEERVFIEAITNQYESREALKYGGTLIAVPLVVGFIVSRLVAQPLWAWAEQMDPMAFAVRDEQKVEGAQEIHREELRLRLEMSIGQAPAITDDEMLQHLRKEARNIAEQIKEKNKQAMLNVVSDSLSAGTLFVLLLQDNSQRAILFRTFGRIFTGLSDTAKAFIIILGTDILLGYHSEEGWTAALRLISGHYGVSPEKELLQLFVATVPVFLDSLFKYWIFVELNKIDPAAAVTLRQMDRH